MEKKVTVPIPKAITDLYEIIDKVGDGGMAQVFRARQKTLNRIVALKLIIPTDSDERAQQLLARFLREAQMSCQLQHPNIVTVFDVSSSTDAPYIAMEYVDGATFSELVHGGISLDEALPLLRDVALALDFAHKAGVIHRDLKPANILVTQHREAKVADWGLAKEQEAATDLTATGGRLGTPLYMSPEQVDGHRMGPTSDLYTLGVIIYRTALICCGKKQSKAMELLARHQTKEVPTLHTVLKDIPRGLGELVSSLLRKNARKRIQSGKEVSERLSSIIDGVKAERKEPPLSEDLGLSLAVDDVTVPQRPLTMSSPRPTTNSARYFFILFTCVLTVILSTYAYRLYPSQSKPTSPLVLIRLSLTAFDELAIVYRGPTKAKRRLVWRDKNGNPSKSRLPMHLDFSRGDEISPNIMRLVLTLRKPIDEPLQISLVDPEGASEPLNYNFSPDDLEKSIFEPLDQMSGPKMNELMARLHDCCKEGGKKEKVESLLSEVGLSGPYFGNLERNLPFLIKENARPNGPMANRLFPLRAIEALIADKPAASLFAPISTLVGFGYSLDTPEPKAGWIRFGRRLYNKNAPQWPLLIGRTHGLAGFKKQTLHQKRVFDMSNAMAASAFGVMPHASVEIRTSHEGRNIWPPKFATLEIHCQGFDRHHHVEVKINDDTPFSMLNCLRKTIREGADWQAITILVRVDPQKLHKDENRIMISTVASTTGHPLWRPLAILWLGFRVSQE